MVGVVHLALKKEIIILNEIDTILKDIINNIDLKDEICARVKKKTYDFIRNWKGEKKLL